MFKPPEHTRHHNAIKLLIHIPFRAYLLCNLQYDTPCSHGRAKWLNPKTIPMMIDGFSQLKEINFRCTLLDGESLEYICKNLSLTIVKLGLCNQEYNLKVSNT